MTAQVPDAPDGGHGRPVPDATVARLAVYLRVLTELRWAATGPAAPLGHPRTISSADLARLAGVKPANLRRDLTFLGSYGVRGVGYDIHLLTTGISAALGADRSAPVALVGLGNLGQALAGYAGFGGRGFRIAALFDADPQRIGRTVAGLVIQDIGDAGRVCREAGIAIGVIATPEHAAQPVADVLVGAGVRSILNFAPGVLLVPDDVQVRRVDLALELQMLAFHEGRRADPAPTGVAVSS
ncbi:redox-sensing transcriptional repressor Rex [Nakamurella flavida]|uniref:Redox-sensing transcriptional repressor Rex n=1 Tax=Nakamurella flavida TaxID=363630 RepID=A0A938YMR6_9ACTN|nr:redox-sensing transcriptional repressor Rex [Nakamurella flavida]MBM9475750.1 redox-sensing transcriptional repressor Rex [Nakamurella flavida]MDP9777970.1 redox-sensing transcriptional repressor [Nakamurella flavida]